MTKGGKNLLILGLMATGFSLAATGVSLTIYHNSGDIYLDRSRPGFLPDESDLNNGEEGTSGDVYVYPEGQKVDETIITEYLKALTEKKEAITKRGEAFGSDVLSDASLGIE